MLEFSKKRRKKECMLSNPHDVEELLFRSLMIIVLTSVTVLLQESTGRGFSNAFMLVIA